MLQVYAYICNMQVHKDECASLFIAAYLIVHQIGENLHLQLSERVK